MKHKTIYLPVNLGKRHGIGRFPNAGPNPNITGMKELYYGKDAYCIKCGRYVYNVGRDFYEFAEGLTMGKSRPVILNGKTIELFAVLPLMDPEIIEDVHERINDIEPCTDQEFIDEYCRTYKEKHGKNFII